MATKIPYMIGVKNLPDILGKIQQAAVPPTFNLDFLRDLGFKSSSDRGIIKMLKYLEMLDDSGVPKKPYHEFMDNTRGKKILADQLRHAYRDLFLANPTAHQDQQRKLKGWFKAKTGESESVAEKIAMTFRHLAKYADFNVADSISEVATMASHEEQSSCTSQIGGGGDEELATKKEKQAGTPMTLTYRLEINLPNTTDVSVYRAIFRALRDELVS